MQKENSSGIPSFEDAEVREVRQNDPLRGKQVVRLRSGRRWILPVLLLASLLLSLLLLLLPGEQKRETVSLPAAKSALLEKQPPLRKENLLRVLRQEGFLAVPGSPEGALEITLSVRREGVILRTESQRLLVPRSLFSQQNP